MEREKLVLECLEIIRNYVDETNDNPAMISATIMTLATKLVHSIIKIHSELMYKDFEEIKQLIMEQLNDAIELMEVIENG